MDTLTHALSGALLARATAPATPRAEQLPPPWRLWVGFWAAAFPDADFILNFVDPLTYLTLHRGVTHSLILLPLWALGLAAFFMLLTRRRYSWRAFFGTCALGIGIHIAGDIITAFGTMVLAPFSHWRAQIPTTFILDPYFTGIIVAGLLASAMWRRARLPSCLALAALAGLVVFQWTQHRRALAVGDDFIAAKTLDAATAHAIPQPFSPFHWMVVVEQPTDYYLAHISLTREEVPAAVPAEANWLRRVHASYLPVKMARWQHVPRFGSTDAELAAAVWNSDALARYRHFALFPAALRIDRDAARTCVWFDDLRFNLIGRHGPFRYGACREDAAAPWRVYRLIEDDDGNELLDKIPE
jgi:inner membrane protein